MTLRPYQERAIAACRQKLKEGVRRLVLVAPTGAGKCLGIGTPVLRYDGGIWPVESIRAGEQLMGPDGAPRTVLSTTRGRGPLFRIVPVKGDPWVCNDVHVLTLVHTETGAIVDVDLQAYLAKSDYWRHCHKLFAPERGIDFAPREPLQVDPYFLGVWFGDGSKRLDRIAVSKPDEEIELLMHATASRWGLRVRTERSGSCPTYHIVGERERGIGRSHRTNPLLNALRGIVRDPQTIPLAMRVSSRTERLAFLAGIIDTDGHASHGCVEIAQRHRGISDGIAFVARSLGLRVSESTKIVDGVEYFRLHLSGDFSSIPTRIARKTLPPRAQKKIATRTGFAVEPIGAGDYAGFELDGDGRFLLGDFTVTHNTVMFSDMIRRAVANGRRALVLAHRRELVDQAVDKLRAIDVDAGVILAGEAESRRAPVQVASIQTLGARRDGVACRRLPEADLVVVDEVHHAVSPTWKRIIESYPDAVVIGATATPWRTDKRGLADLFETHVLAATVAELIENGSLSPYDVRAYDAPDLHEVPITAGEFNQRALTLACNTSVLVGGIVRDFMSYHGGRRALLFPVSIEHSLALVAELRSKGIAADHIDGDTPKDERKAIIARLARGAVQVVSSVGCFTEGFDSPGVEICILARPTMSLTLHLQMCGRGLRPAPGKAKALLVDHGGNFLRHGLPDDERDYSLTATPKRVDELHRCPFCLQVFHRLGDDGSCPKCGEIIAPPREVREENARREKERIEGEIINAERIKQLRQEAAARESTEEKRKFWRGLCAQARNKRYAPGWVYVRFKLKYGHPPNFGKVT